MPTSAYKACGFFHRPLANAANLENTSPYSPTHDRLSSWLALVLQPENDNPLAVFILVLDIPVIIVGPSAHDGGAKRVRGSIDPHNLEFLLQVVAGHGG